MHDHTPLGGLLEAPALTQMLDHLASRAPQIEVRWDRIAMSVGRAVALARSRPADDQVLALLLMDGQRQALCLSTRPGTREQGAA